MAFADGVIDTSKWHRMGLRCPECGSNEVVYGRFTPKNMKPWYCDDCGFEADVEEFAPKPGAYVSENKIEIYDEEGEEIISWEAEVWEADPSILPEIANAIRLVFTKGPAEVKNKLKEVHDGGLMP